MDTFDDHTDLFGDSVANTFKEFDNFWNNEISGSNFGNSFSFAAESCESSNQALFNCGNDGSFMTSFITKFSSNNSFAQPPKAGYDDILNAPTASSSSMSHLERRKLVAAPAVNFYMDMTYDDRVYLGVHHRRYLDTLLLNNSCKIDFSAEQGKVLITGKSVDQILIVVNSILTNLFHLQEFYLRCDVATSLQEFTSCMSETAKYLSANYTGSHFVYEMIEPGLLKVQFGCIRSQYDAIKDTITVLLRRAAQPGLLCQNIQSFLTYNNRRREIIGRNRVHLNNIEKETSAKIISIAIRSEFEQFKIVGDTFQSVFNARWEFINLFVYSLEFFQIIPDINAYNSNFRKIIGGIKEVTLTVEPTTTIGQSKVVLSSGEKFYRHLFVFREELLKTNFA